MRATIGNVGRLLLLGVLGTPFGCSVIVAGKLDEKDADADVDADTDTDTDTDGACSLADGAAHGVESDVVINFAGGSEQVNGLIATGESIAGAGADLALIAAWTGTSSFGYETQLFDENWVSVTGHQRIVTLDDDPQSPGAIASSDDTVYGFFPSREGVAGTIVQVPMTFNAVAGELEQGDRFDAVTFTGGLTKPVAVLADDHVFYAWSEAGGAEVDKSVFGAYTGIDVPAADEPLQLNPGPGEHVNPDAAFSDSEDMLVWVYEREGALSTDIFYGRVDTLPSQVQRAAPGISPPAQRSGLPAIAVSGNTALITFANAPSLEGDFNIRFQIVRVDDGTLGAENVIGESPGQENLSAVTFHPDLEEFGVAWAVDDAEVGGVHAARIDLEGNIVQADTLVSQSTAPRARLAIAPVSFGYAIVWDAGPEGLRTGWLGCPPEE